MTTTLLEDLEALAQKLRGEADDEAERTERTGCPYYSVACCMADSAAEKCREILELVEPIIAKAQQRETR